VCVCVCVCVIFNYQNNGKKKSGFILRVLHGVRHQLGAEVTDGKEVIGPFNQLPVLLIEHWQAEEAHTHTHRLLIVHT